MDNDVVGGGVWDDSIVIVNNNGGGKKKVITTIDDNGENGEKIAEGRIQIIVENSFSRHVKTCVKIPSLTFLLHTYHLPLYSDILINSPNFLFGLLDSY